MKNRRRNPTREGERKAETTDFHQNDKDEFGEVARIL